MLSVLGGGVGGMNTPTGVIPLPRVAMNGKITASSPVAVVPNGEPGEDRRLSISVICYLIPPPFFLVQMPHFSPHVLKNGVVKISNPVSSILIFIRHLN